MLSVATPVACEATADGPAATSPGCARFLRESRAVFRLTPSMDYAQPVEAGNHAPEAGPASPWASLIKLILLGGLALLALALWLWPGLPPVNQDEYLPLLPMSWFIKEPNSRTSLLRSYVIRVLGYDVPALAYPYVGSLKGLLYAATSFPALIPTYRRANLFLVGCFFSLVLWATSKLSRGSLVAAKLCLVFLIADTSLIVLGITDEGPIMIGLILATVLLMLLTSAVEAPRWWLALPVALVVFLGVWDRLNFVWFVAAGLMGCAAASIARPLRDAARLLTISAIGCAIGLAAAAYFLPQYTKAVLAPGKGIPVRDLTRLWEHWIMLMNVLDPFAAYHRYISVNSIFDSGRALYVAYRWVFSILALTVMVASLRVAALRLRQANHCAGLLLFLGAFLVSLFVSIIKTAHAWSSHHIILVKPFVYIALSSLLVETTRFRGPLIALAALLATGFGYTGIRGYVDMQSAPPILGVYDVSWNAVEAWQAAARSDVPTIYALDWGVFYPGVVNSRATQRWEMTEAKNPQELLRLGFGRSAPDFGLLFRASGPHRWLLTASNEGRNYAVVERQEFDRHKGERWIFLIVNTPGQHTIKGIMDEHHASLIKNPAFREGETYWLYEKWEKEPGSAELTIVPCSPTGGQACAQITHRVAADSRIIQEIDLAPQALYEITAQARAQGVGETRKGVHLCIMDHLVESGELRGDTDWHQLSLYISSPNRHRRIRLAARLGTFGEINTGTAWFTQFHMREVPAIPEGARIFELTGEL